MKKSGSQKSKSPSQLIDAKIEELARISHTKNAHRGANQRKLFCENDFCLIQEPPRC